jgi:uncharacterized membrane protein
MANILERDSVLRNGWPGPASRSGDGKNGQMSEPELPGKQAARQESGSQAQPPPGQDLPGQDLPGQDPPGQGLPGQDPPRGGHRLPDPWHELVRLAGQVTEGRPVGDVLPGWRRRTRGEPRYPVSMSVIAAIVLQLLLPDRLNRPLPHYLLPALEGALLIGLSVANPVRIERRGNAVRVASIALIMLMTAANAVSAVLLIRAILGGLSGTETAGPLLTSGAAVWATNVIAFALWYWEFDLGGPVNRAEGAVRHPALMFPQMASPELAPPHWKPYFVDYLYLSFTNATAFSPTDVMPLARWAKLAMAVQSAVSLLVGALVIARAVNILR